MKLKTLHRINDALLGRLNLHITRGSTWRNIKERESLASSPRAGDRIRRLGEFLRPYEVVGFSKVRVGSRFDGGYICVDDFEGIKAALSFGIGSNDDWDIHIAQRGIEVFQFDHSIDNTPSTHPNCHFSKKKIVCLADMAPGSEMAGHLIEQHGGGEAGSLLMKMDIESDEWGVLQELRMSQLELCAQVICEFHLFSRIVGDEEKFERAIAAFQILNESFATVHVHANNFVAPCYLGGVPFPELLEVTFASRGRYKFEVSREIFPTHLDAPNDPTKPDLFLGAFTFTNGFV